MKTHIPPLRSLASACAFSAFAAFRGFAAEAPPPSGPDEGLSFVTWSDWKFVPQLAVLATYDDNLFITPGNRVSDSYLQVAPGLALGLGDFRSQVAPFAPIPHFLAQTGEEDLPRAKFVYVDYTPDFEVFARERHQDTVNHDVRFSGGDQGELWDFKGALRYQRVEDPDIYVGERTKQSYSSATLDGDYRLGGKLTAGLQATGDRSTVSGGLTEEQGLALGYLDLQTTEKSSVGLGWGAGDLRVQGSADQYSFQPLLRFKYELSPKIGLAGNAGFDWRSFNRGVSHVDEPIFDVAANYETTENTVVTLSARRATIGSIEYRGVDVWEGIYQASVRQKILEEFFVTGSAGLVRDDYRPFQRSLVLARLDNYTFFKAALGRDLTKHGTVQLAFERRDNDSSVSSFGFAENLLTLNASFLF